MSAFPEHFSATAGMPRFPFSQAEDSTQASDTEPTRGTAGHPPASAGSGNMAGVSPFLIECIMSTRITYNRRRRPARKAEDFITAWRKIAPDAKFGGKTLAEFEAATAPLKDAVVQLQTLTIQRSAAQKTRDEKEDALKGLLVLIAHGVRSAPDHGEDSPLYRAMGFVPKSERASGLIRPPAKEETAA